MISINLHSMRLLSLSLFWHRLWSIRQTLIVNEIFDDVIRQMKFQSEVKCYRFIKASFYVCVHSFIHWWKYWRVIDIYISVTTECRSLFSLQNQITGTLRRQLRLQVLVIYELVDRIVDSLLIPAMNRQNHRRVDILMAKALMCPHRRRRLR